MLAAATTASPLQPADIRVEPRRVRNSARLAVRWIMALGCVLGPWALLSSDAASSLRLPMPRWAVRGLFTAYIGAAVAGVSAYVLLWSAAGRFGRLGSVHDQARLVPTARRWIAAAVIGGLSVELAPPLLVLQLAWLPLRDAVAPAHVAGLHVNLLGLGLLLGLARARLELQFAGSRWPVGGLAVLLAVAVGSALWLPPLLPHGLNSRVYGPVLVALNPVLAAAEAAKVDLLRHGLWYGLSPLATSRFTPPPAALCAALPLSIAILLAVTFRQSTYRARVG